MKKITFEDVCLAHDNLIKRTGGKLGIINVNLLISSIEGIYQTFDCIELYPEIEDKAAFLCYSLIKNHPFEDGNKRIGINMLQTFLLLNEYYISVTNEDLIDLGLGIADSRYDLVYIKSWIKNHKKL